MNGFLYYLPDVSQAAADAAIATHLLHAIDPRRRTVRGVTGGPDGGAGVIVADARIDEVGYFRDRQTWHCMIAEHVHVGHFTDRPLPGPADLARAKLLDGFDVTLADGNPWHVPVARAWADLDGETFLYRNNFPQRSRLDPETGQWVRGDVLPEYADLWQTAEAWWETRYAAAADAEADETADAVTVRFDFDDAHHRAVDALAANYRLGPVEVSLLGLLTESLVVEVLDVLIDQPTLIAWGKKKATAGRPPDGSATDAGPPAAPPGTAPPWPTSCNSTPTPN